MEYLKFQKKVTFYTVLMCGATDDYERDTYIIVQLNNVIIAMMLKEILQLTKLYASLLENVRKAKIVLYTVLMCRRL